MSCGAISRSEHICSSLPRSKHSPRHWYGILPVGFPDSTYSLSFKTDQLFSGGGQTSVTEATPDWLHECGEAARHVFITFSSVLYKNQHMKETLLWLSELHRLKAITHMTAIKWASNTVLRERLGQCKQDRGWSWHVWHAVRTLPRLHNLSSTCPKCRRSCSEDSFHGAQGFRETKGEETKASKRCELSYWRHSLWHHYFGKQ